jgi:hypothetical protein
VSADGCVDRTAKALVRGAGEAGDDAGDAEEPGSGELDGEVLAREAGDAVE